jgi:hypothetical protein
VPVLVGAMDSDEEGLVYDEYENDLISKFNNGSITPQLIESIPDTMWRRLPLLEAAVRYREAFYDHASPAIRDNPEFMLARVRERGTDLQYASKRLRADPDIFGVAVMQAGTYALPFVDERFREHHLVQELAMKADEYRQILYREKLENTVYYDATSDNEAQ